MNWTKIEKSLVREISERAARADRVDVEILDKAANRMDFYRDGRAVLRIERGDYRGLNVFIPAKPPVEKRWVVRADVPGGEFEIAHKTFKGEWEAKQLQQKLEARFGEDATVIVEEAMVEIDE